MERVTEIIGEKEYAFSKIGAFEGNAIILKLQKLILPIFGELAGGGKKSTKDLMEMDIGPVFKIISENVDQAMIDNIVFPMFKLAQVASVTDNVKIDSKVNFDKVFTVDTLGDFYELIFLVLKFNFGNFLQGLMARFGNSGGDQAAAAPTSAD